VSLSRRQALAAAATVGVGLTAGSAIGIASAHDKPNKGPDRGKGDGAGGALVIHVRDLAAGTLDVFTGTERIEVRDRDLANRLAKAARKR